ncbi:MAG: type II toxin-antitoxin system Phd/YefM family antitoxin [Terriglobales bacterium]|jgi:prevent-host-death family protein
MEINIHEAKTQFSRLIKRVEAGEEITVARAGKPVIKLIAIGPPNGKRPMGMDKGKIWIADDFDAPDPELEALFYDAPFTTNSPRKKNRKKKR